MNDEEPERINVAYHEAGHALLSFFSTRQDISEITIEPGEGFEGQNRYVNGVTTSRDWESQVDTIKILFAGTIAEDKHTSERTKVNKDILCVAAILYWRETGENVMEEFLGLTADNHFTLNKVNWIFKEYREQIDEILRGIGQTLNEYWNVVEALASALLERETLQVNEVRDIIEDQIKDL